MESLFAIQRVQHILTIITEALDGDCVGFQKAGMGYVGGRCSLYLDSLYIILDELARIEKLIRKRTPSAQS